MPFFPLVTGLSYKNKKKLPRMTTFATFIISLSWKRSKNQSDICVSGKLKLFCTINMVNADKYYGKV